MPSLFTEESCKRKIDGNIAKGLLSSFQWHLEVICQIQKICIQVGKTKKRTWISVEWELRFQDHNRYLLPCRSTMGGDWEKNCGLSDRKASEVLVSVFPVILKLLFHSCHIKISWMYHKLLIEGVQLENWKESLSRVFSSLKQVGR